MEAWIIEELSKKEEIHHEVRIDLPIESAIHPDVEVVESEGERGVITINIYEQEEEV